MSWASIHTGMVGGAPVRFFRAPGEKPDFPYHSVDDLHAALKLPRALRRELKSGLAKSQWRNDIKVAVQDGDRTLIAPHFMAQGIIGAAVDQGAVAASLDLEYRLAGMAAFKAECALLGLTTAQTADRAFVCATGRSDVHLTRMVNTDTGEVSINLAEAQAALGLSDEELQRSVLQMHELGHAPQRIDASKLARLQ